MTLEELMTKLIVSLDANTAALTGKAPAAAGKPAGAKATPKTDTPAVDFDLVKKAAAAVKDKLGAPVAKKIIKEAGVSDSLNATKPENYAALLAALLKAVEAEAEATDEEDEDL